MEAVYLPYDMMEEKLKINDLVRQIGKQMQESGFYDSQKPFFFDIPPEIASDKTLINCLENHYNAHDRLFATVIYGQNGLPKWLGITKSNSQPKLYIQSCRN